MELVEAGNQAHDGRLAGAGMPNNGDIFPRRDVKIKVFQYLSSGGVLEAKVVEINSAFEAFHLEIVALDDGMFRIDQGEDAFGGGKPGLDLGPVGSDAQDRHQEAVARQEDHVPCASGDQALGDGESAEVDQNGDADAADSAHNRKDDRKDETALDVDLERGDVGSIEVLVDLFFLAEIFGN